MNPALPSSSHSCLEIKTTINHNSSGAKRKKKEKFQQWIYTETWDHTGFLPQLLWPNCVRKESTQTENTTHLLKSLLETLAYQRL